MSDSVIYCPICGNEVPAGTGICPWCEHQLQRTGRKGKKVLLKTVNIKSDNPDIQTAHSRLLKALHSAKAQQVRVLKIIHGYGSSGKGGDICWFVRDYLEKEKYSPTFKYYVTGERFCTGFSEGELLVREFPQLKRDKDWKRKNRGITLVVLR